MHLMEDFSYQKLVMIGAIFLYSTMIGDEQLKKAAGSQITPVVSVKKTEHKGQLKRPEFMEGGQYGFDKEAFLLSFKRQAANGLSHCLRKHKKDNSSMLLVGVITSSGRLDQIKSLDTPIPPCVSENISKMDFRQLTRSFSKPFLSVHWRVDW